MSAMMHKQSAEPGDGPAVTVSAGGLTLAINSEALRPLLEAIVRDVVDRCGGDGRIAYSESEAAALLGVPRHTLRDARLAGQVHAVKIGRGVRYSRSELLRLLSGPPVG